MGANKSRSLNNCQQPQNYPPGLSGQGGSVPSMVPPSFGYGGFPVSGFPGYTYPGYPGYTGSNGSFPNNFNGYSINYNG